MHRARRLIRRSHLASMLIVLVGCTGTSTLRLEAPPAVLALPLPDGTNELLSARVSGTAPRRVFLVHEETDTRGVPLEHVGGGLYQINLGSEAVSQLVEHEREGRELRVRAELTDGTFLTSVPVEFSRRLLARTAPSFFAFCDEQGDDGRALAGAPRWLEPGEIARFEARAARGSRPTAVRARVGELTAEFPATRTPGIWSLRLDRQLRDAWLRDGTLALECRWPPEWRTELELCARPHGVQLDGAVASMTVPQRRTRPVPGTRGYYLVSLDDITAGQVRATLRTAEGETVIDWTSLRQGDALSFDVGGETVHLRVRRLANLLIGDDWAEIDVSALPLDTLGRIDRLLQRVASSAAVWIRNGREYAGRDAADHLRAKLAAATVDIRTPEQFIELIASRSSMSGQPYRVRRADGTTVESAQWLRSELAHLDEIPEAPVAGQ